MKKEANCRVVFRIVLISGMACSILLAVATPSGLCDSEGNYPGTGDYSAWKQAADASEDGVIYAKKGNQTMAIQCYDEAIQLYPGDASFYFNKATALHKANRATEAVPMFAKAVSLEPKFTSAWYNMGNVQKELNNLAGAEESFKQALSLDPKHMKAWFNLGETYFSTKKYQEAKNAFEHAQELANTEQDKTDISNYRQEIERILRKSAVPSQAAKPSSQTDDKSQTQATGSASPSAADSARPGQTLPATQTPPAPTIQTP